MAKSSSTLLKWASTVPQQADSTGIDAGRPPAGGGHLGVFLDLIHVFPDLDGPADQKIVFAVSTAAYLPAISRDVISRYNELIGRSILPLPQMFHSRLTADQLIAEMGRVRNGGFDASNPVHADLNYHLLREDMKRSWLGPELSYTEFMAMLERARAGKPLARTTDEAQIRGLAVEGHLLWKKIVALQKRAMEVSREFVVVENLSYGAVALSPISCERQGQRFIRGVNGILIPVWSTKIGSTESHKNEFVLRDDLFTDEQTAFLLRAQPIVAVVDGTTSVAAPDRSLPHVPDGFKGYRNYFIAINAALGVRVPADAFAVDNRFVSSMKGQATFKSLVERLKKGVPRRTARPYTFHFWYPGRKLLYLRVGKRKNKVPRKLTDESAIRGPAVIFMQAAIESEAVDPAIRNNYIKCDHAPAYFDDRKPFNAFDYEYEPGYGITVSRTFVLRVRQAYRELLTYLREEGAVPLELVLTGSWRAPHRADKAKEADSRS